MVKRRNLPAGKSYEIIKSKPKKIIVEIKKKLEIDFSFLDFPYTCNYCEKEYESKEDMRNYCELCHYGLCNNCYEILMKNIKK